MNLPIALSLGQARVAVFVLGALPGLALIAALVQGNLGVNPVETLLDTTGIWAVRFLLLTLMLTPLRWLTGWSKPIQLRRQIGLWAFAYALAHFAVYAVFEHRLSIGAIVDDIIQRPFILMGATALLMLLALALTSTRGWIRRLGRQWKRLHQLIYPAAILVLVHFFMLIRADRWTEPLIYAAILALLLGLRLVWRLPWRRSALR